MIFSDFAALLRSAKLRQHTCRASNRINKNGYLGHRRIDIRNRDINQKNLRPFFASLAQLQRGGRLVTGQYS
jgi:hypothetical protein